MIVSTKVPNGFARFCPTYDTSRSLPTLLKAKIFLPDNGATSRALETYPEFPVQRTLVRSVISYDVYGDSTRTKIILIREIQVKCEDNETRPETPVYSYVYVYVCMYVCTGEREKETKRRG